VRITHAHGEPDESLFGHVGRRSRAVRGPGSSTAEFGHRYR
jgi:hypothetical protein